MILKTVIPDGYGGEMCKLISDSGRMIKRKSTNDLREEFIEKAPIDDSDYEESVTIEEYELEAQNVQEEAKRIIAENEERDKRESMLSPESQAQLEMQANIQYLVDLAEINMEV